MTPRCDARVLSLIDLFHAHVGSMDAFAKGLRVAAAIQADNALSDPLTARYSSWDGELGKKIEAGESSLAELEAIMLGKGEAAANQSGRQEMLLNVFNRYIDRS